MQYDCYMVKIWRKKIVNIFSCKKKKLPYTNHYTLCLEIKFQEIIFEIFTLALCKYDIWESNYSADIYKILSSKLDPNSGIRLSTGLSVTRGGVTRESI